MEQWDPKNVFNLSDQDIDFVCLVLNTTNKLTMKNSPFREEGTLFKQYDEYKKDGNLRRKILYGNNSSSIPEMSFSWDLFEWMVLIPLFNFCKMKVEIFDEEDDKMQVKKVSWLRPVNIQKSTWQKEVKKFCLTIVREIIKIRGIKSSEVNITRGDSYNFVIGIAKVKGVDYKLFRYPGHVELKTRLRKITENLNGEDKIDWLSWKDIPKEKFEGLSNPEKAVQMLDEKQISTSVSASMKKINPQSRESEIFTKVITVKNKKTKDDEIKGGIVHIKNFLPQDFLKELKYLLDEKQKYFEMKGRNGDRRFIRVTSFEPELSLQYSSNHGEKHVKCTLANEFEQQIIYKMNILCEELHQNQCAFIDKKSGNPGEGVNVLGKYQPIRILAYCITRDFDKSFGSHQDRNANIVSNDHPAYRMLIPTLVLHISQQTLKIGCDSKPAKLCIQIQTGNSFHDLETIETPHNSLHLQLFGNQENLFHTVKPVGIYDEKNVYFRLVITGRRSIKQVDKHELYQPPSQAQITKSMFYIPVNDQLKKEKQKRKSNTVNTTVEDDFKRKKQRYEEVKTKSVRVRVSNNNQDESVLMPNDVTISSRMKGFHFLVRWEIQKILLEKGIFVEVEIANMENAFTKQIKEITSVLNTMMADGGITEASENELKEYLDKRIQESKEYSTTKITHGPLFRSDGNIYMPGDEIDANEFKSLVNIEKKFGKVIASDENLAIGLLMKHEERNIGMKIAASNVPKKQEDIVCMGGGGAASLHMDNTPDLRSPIDGSYGTFAGPQVSEKYPNKILQKMWELGRPLHVAAVLDKQTVKYLGKYYIDSMSGHAGRLGSEFKGNNFDDKKKATFLLSKHYEFKLRPLVMKFPITKWRKIVVKSDEKFSFGVVAPRGFSLKIGEDECITEQILINKFDEEEEMFEYLIKERGESEHLQFNGKQIKLVTPWKIQCSCKQLLTMSCIVNVAACLRYTTKKIFIDKERHEYLHCCYNSCLPSANRMFDATTIYTALKIQKLFKSTKDERIQGEEQYPLKRICKDGFDWPKQILKSVIIFIYFVRITGDVKALSVLFKAGVPYSEDEKSFKHQWNDILSNLGGYQTVFISKQWGQSLGVNVGKKHVRIRMEELISQLTDEKLDEILQSFKTFVDFVDKCVVDSVKQEVKSQRSRFIACLIASDLAEFVDGLWEGEEINPDDYTAGFGGLQGLSVLREDLQTLLQEVKKVKNPLFLQCLGFRIAKEGEIRSIVNGRLLSVSDIEHFCCKLYLFLNNTFGGRQPVSGPKLKNFTHPILAELEGEDQKESEIFFEQANEIISSFDRLIQSDEWKQNEYQIPNPTRNVA